MPERLITLAIDEAPTAAGDIFVYKILYDERLLVANARLSVELSEQVRDVGETYEAVFSNPQDPASFSMAPAHVKAIGTTLFDIWLKASWPDLAAQPGDRRILVIASGISEILNLPWELLRPPEREDIGTNAGWGVRRLPWVDRRLVEANDLRSGPLRVLILASSPRSLPELDYELEEELLRGALQSKARVQCATLGTMDELIELVGDFHPHVIHLSGHGSLGQDGAAFHFESVKGESDRRSARKLALRLAGTGVRCVFVSGCETGKAPPRNALGGVCQALVAEGIPIAIGWAASIVDELAAKIATTFYRAIANGYPVDLALAQARLDGRDIAGDGNRDPSWSLPVLYASTIDVRVLNETLPKAEPAAINVQQRVNGMAYAQPLIGRRRDFQVVLPGLLDGTIKGVVVTGIGGAGKSSFATRLARILEASPGHKLKPIAVPCRTAPALRPEVILAVCANELHRFGHLAVTGHLRDPKISEADRLSMLVNDLNETGNVLVIDNLENLTDEKTRFIQDATMAEFYKNLLNNQTGESRVIVTSRHLPADVDPLPEGIVELRLGDLSEIGYIKFMLGDVKIKRRFGRTGNRELLPKLSYMFGSAPSLAKRIRTKLANIDPSELKADIESGLGKDAQTSPRPLDLLETEYKDYCAAIGVDRLHGLLTPEVQRIFGRLAIYAAPMSESDAIVIAAVTNPELKEAIEALYQSALTYGDWTAATASVYGGLRRWLSSSPRMAASDRIEAHRAAAAYCLKRDDQSRTKGYQTTNLDWLLQAHRHYLAAQDFEQARVVVRKLSVDLHRRGEYAEVERLNRELLETLERARRMDANVELHPDPATWVGRCLIEQAKYDEAREVYDRALTLAGESYPIERAHAIQGLASIDEKAGRRATAREGLQRALDIQVQANDRHGQATTWHYLGWIDFQEKLYDAADQKYQTASRLMESAEKPDVLGRLDEQAIWHQLGSIELIRENLPQAQKWLEKALETAQEFGDRKAQAYAINQLGRIDAKRGRISDALQKMRQALDIRQCIGDKAGEASSFRRLGDLARQLGYRELALRLSIVGYFINRNIHNDTSQDEETMQKLSAELQYDQNKLEAMTSREEQAFLTRHSRELLKQAFAMRTSA